MKHPPEDTHVHRRFAPTALMLGNVVTGCSVLAPAGMLSELSEGLGVTIRDAGLLITFGAIVLCIGSPLTAWLTSRIERRTLLTATLAVLALTNAASAFAPDYTTLLVIRLIMLAVGALYTPQAAGTAALIVPAEKRGSTIAYIFLGWSLAAAVGLPLITFIASRYGWRAVYGSIGLVGALSFLLLAWRLPGGLVGSPVDLKTWADVGRNRMIVLLLSITTLQMSGQFVVFTFMGPLLTKLTGAGPDAVGLWVPPARLGPAALPAHPRRDDALRRPRDRGRARSGRSPTTRARAACTRSVRDPARRCGAGLGADVHGRCLGEVQGAPAGRRELGPGPRTIGDIGFVVLILVTGIAFSWSRRPESSWHARALVVLSALYIAALGVAWWVMTAKPGL